MQSSKRQMSSTAIVVGVIRVFAEEHSINAVHSDSHARISEMIKEHLKLERTAGGQIHPAAVQQCKSSAFAQAEKCKCGLREALHNEGIINR